MRKAVNLIIITLAVLLAAPIGAAFASSEEVLVYEQFGTGSWATWFQAEKGWDHGKPGDGKTYTTDPHEYVIPAEKLKDCKLTRIEVKADYSFDAEAFEKAGGWQRVSEYNEYAKEILQFAPDGLDVANTHDLATGKVDITWSLKLGPTQPPVGGQEARETVDPSIRQKLRELGFNLEDDKTYDTAEQGWLWCLPVHVQWFGIPRQAPDFAVQFDTELIQQPPGSTVNTGVTYKLNADHDKPETAKLELFQQREDGSLVKRITPPDGVVREFQPGEAYRVPVSLQMSTIDTDIIAVIRPVSTATDRDWDNNRDWVWLAPREEAPILDGSTEYKTPDEESKIRSELGG